MNNLNIKKGDNVKVIAGKDKNKTGKILSVDIDSRRVVVEGRNIVSKNVKARSAQETGGIKKIPSSIDVSNVQIICPSCSSVTRVAHAEVDGKKIRVCKKCEKSLDIKLKAEKKSAKKVKADEAVDSSEKPAKKVKAKAGDVETTTKSATKKVAKTEEIGETKPVKKTAAKKVEATDEIKE